MPYLLLTLGILMIFLEFFLPGIVMGVGGLFFIGASIVFFGMEATSSLALLLYAAAVVVLLIALVRFALWRIRRSGAHATFFLATDEEGFRADNYDATLIGKKGTAVTDLRPSGRVNVDGRVLQALSQGGFIAKESTITVIGGEGAALLVKPLTEG